MTYATDHGFEIGKRYRVTENDTPSHSPEYYTKGMIVEFSRDDGTSCPFFRCISGTSRLISPGLETCISLERVEPLDKHEEVQDNTFLLNEYIRINYPKDAFLRILIDSERKLK